MMTPTNIYKNTQDVTYQSQLNFQAIKGLSAGHKKLMRQLLNTPKFKTDFGLRSYFIKPYPELSLRYIKLALQSYKLSKIEQSAVAGLTKHVTNRAETHL